MHAMMLWSAYVIFVSLWFGIKLSWFLVPFTARAFQANLSAHRRQARIGLGECFRRCWYSVLRLQSRIWKVKAGRMGRTDSVRSNWVSFSSQSDSHFSYIFLTLIQSLYAYFVEGNIVYLGKRKTFSRRVRFLLRTWPHETSCWIPFSRRSFPRE